MDTIFGFIAKRTLDAINGIFPVCAEIMKSFADFDLKKMTALFVTLAQLLGAAVFDTPVTPYKDSIDMSRFELVWEDDFDNGFDTSVWQGHYVYGAEDTQLRDVAYWNRDQVSFTEDGCLEITVEYKEDVPYLEYFANGGCPIEFMKDINIWGEDLTAYEGFAEAVAKNLELIKAGKELL